MIAMGLFGLLAGALATYTSTATRLVIRNLATNHSHDVVRVGGGKILTDLHASSSRFRLISFDGSIYTDVTPIVTPDLDAL